MAPDGADIRSCQQAVGKPAAKEDWLLGQPAGLVEGVEQAGADRAGGGAGEQLRIQERVVIGKYPRFGLRYIGMATIRARRPRGRALSDRC